MAWTTIAVQLVERSQADLSDAMAVTGETATDTINRAIQWYALYQHIASKGGRWYVQRHWGARMERIEIE